VGTVATYEISKLHKAQRGTKFNSVPGHHIYQRLSRPARNFTPVISHLWLHRRPLNPSKHAEGGPISQLKICGTGRGLGRGHHRTDGRAGAARTSRYSHQHARRGIEKTGVLQVFKPNIFFDDQQSHVISCSKKLPTAQVCYSNQPAKKPARSVELDERPVPAVGE
jgi:5'-nucleotidase